ncbi:MULTISPECIES: response regulator [Pseudoalteromonas]|uniref:Two-component system response regulator n=1 Tax=Pseudoalteromonas amylolytica TaxID=1859457 RepID=A0A1S1MUA3_9GAMM|nr:MULTISPECIES: two-component system response regulator [Pseudoalteromonas]OHU84999.1 two-component system response regulator [Pseudoalteromonas sp. JW3]OHU90050.1 two-component system response regulator [Pseudoalteromonas amylolytica]
MAEKFTVLLVDDTSLNLALMSEILKDEYRVIAAKSGESALNILNTKPVDIVLLDIIMPEMDGYEVIKKIKATEKLADIPVIFLTAKNSIQDEELGFSLGACDYINKPISPPIVQSRIRTHIQIKRHRDLLKNQNAYLESEVQKRTKELSDAQDATITAMACLAETRDQETGNHIKRTQLYVKELATRLATLPKYEHVLTKEVIELFYKSAPLHDIGKVGIPDAILLKQGRLTDVEFEVMKTHAQLGYEAIAKAEEELSGEIKFLEIAKEIARSHHEKWDGSGYPLGLSGEDIPLSARLMAIADVYDALISKRVYKDAMPHAQALSIISEGRGSHFDPEILDEFLAIEKVFYSIAQQYAD